MAPPLPLPPPPPPFSIVEFGNLVALALETDLADRFSESFLQFDPELLRRTTADAPTAPSSVDLLKTPHAGQVAVNSLKMPSSPWADSQSTSPSRPRLLLDKIKHKASALVSRAPVQTRKPTVVNKHASFFDYDDAKSHSPGGLFAPYLPLAAQFERATARKSKRAIFSRPASLVTAPPPSPTRSLSTSSSSNSPSSPITPTTDADADFFAPVSPHRPSVSVSASASPCSPNTSRWSLSTDESTTSSYSFSYPNHPFASTHDVTHDHDDPDPDPFAKGRVQVIRNSADYPSYTYAFSRERERQGSASASVKRRSLARPQTATPTASPSPPASPLPASVKAKVLRIRLASPTQTPPDWTLALPTHTGTDALTFPRPPSTPPRRRMHNNSTPSSESSSSSDAHSLCPSAWNPTPPSSPAAARKRKSVQRPGTATRTKRERERARALAALNGDVHPSAMEVFCSSASASASEEKEGSDEGTFYSACSRFPGPRPVGTPKAGRVRVRVDSEVRPVGC